MASFTELVSDTRKVFKSGRTLEVSWRLNQLKNLLRMIEEQRDAMVAALKKDLNKHKLESVGMEINFARNECVSFLNNTADWAKPQYVKKDMLTMMDTCYIKPEPLGVVLIIGAWNYPIQLVLHPLIGAIAAGNCVILKPSELSEACATLLGEIIPKYLDKECFHVVNGGIPETTALLKERFDHILYTGNNMVAKIIMKAAAEHLTPVTLELGGKSPCYVDKSSDMNIAARRILWGRMVNAGQTCIAPDYVICSKDVQPKLLERMKATLKEFYGEDPQKSPDMARIVNQRHFNRIKKLMEGTTIALGGRSDEGDKYIEPTVVVDVKASDPIMQEEIFGPVLPIYNIESVDEAIEFLKDREKPLSTYIFSKDMIVTNRLIYEAASGGTCVNDTIMQGSLDTLPFGGVGQSGTGAYHGKFSFDTFSHMRAVMVKAQSLEQVNGLRYPPYTEKKMSWLAMLMKKSPRRGGIIKYLPMILIIGFLAFIIKAYGR